MLLSSLRRILSIIIAAVLIASSAITAFAEDGSSEVDVLLPYDVPFKILISRRDKQGIICSDEFEIVNNGDNDVSVEISAIRIEIENENGYYISDTRELPETGSNIFMELICLNDQEPSSIVMTDTPSEVVHTYNLKGGEVGKFKFDGTVNEIDGPPWGDTVVQVQICIRVVGAELIAPDEEEPIETEEVANSDSDKNENTDAVAETPAQETEQNSTDTVNEGNTNNANGTDDINTQENQTDAGADAEESEREANDSADPIDGQSLTEPAHSSAKENNAESNDKNAVNTQTLDIPHSS